MKTRSLGSVASAARGILMTGGTNATPIAATITAGHRLKDGDRIGIVGVTGNTSQNGDFPVDTVAATTCNLTGSAGNGTFGGTAVVAVLCDRTPFQPRNSALAFIGHTPGAAVLVGTVVLEGADQRKSDNTEFGYSDSAGAYVSGFVSALMTGEIAIPAATAGIGIGLEVSLRRYMTMRASAYTSGGAHGWLAA